MNLIRQVSETQRSLEKFVQNTHYTLECVCKHHVDDIGKHFAASHMLEVELENLQSKLVGILVESKRKHDSN